MTPSRRELLPSRLGRSGWSFGWCSEAGPEGEQFLVDGTNGGNSLRPEAATLAEALRLACDQARAVSMPGPAAVHAGGRR
jgi:hypothetical protein